MLYFILLGNNRAEEENKHNHYTRI